MGERFSKSSVTNNLCFLRKKPVKSMKRFGKKNPNRVK